MDAYIHASVYPGPGSRIRGAAKERVGDVDVGEGESGLSKTRGWGGSVPWLLRAACWQRHETQSVYVLQGALMMMLFIVLF